MTIKVHYHTNITPLAPIRQGDWIDLRCAEEVAISPNTYIEIPLGISIQLPPGYEAIVAPRSSTFRNYGIILVNSIGVIDESYCGDDDEWRFPAYGTREAVIPKDARIAQFRIIEHQPGVDFVTVPTLGNKSRGGLGSTGVI